MAAPWLWTVLSHDATPLLNECVLLSFLPMKTVATLLCTLAHGASATAFLAGRRVCTLAQGAPFPAGRRLAPSLRPARAFVSACSPADDNSDHMATAVSRCGSVSAKAIVTSSLVNEATRLQGLGGLAAVALGRALTCSLLVADGLKDDETFQINFNGDGPLRGVMATANGKLESRGYVGNPAVTLPPNAAGKLDVGAGVGQGSLSVVRTKHLPGAEAPTQYSSITAIRSGEIPEDVNFYLLESEQRQGALAAGVFVSSAGEGLPCYNPGAPSAGAQVEIGAAAPMPAPAVPASSGLRVEAAGGWYVQLLPFAAEEAIEQLEANIAAIQSRSPTTLVREGLDARGIVELLLQGLEPQFAPDKRVKSVAESCPCSEERVLRTMALIPKAELADILNTNEVVEARCEFCGTTYRSTPEQMRERLAAAALSE